MNIFGRQISLPLVALVFQYAGSNACITTLASGVCVVSARLVATRDVAAAPVLTDQVTIGSRVACARLASAYTGRGIYRGLDGVQLYFGSQEQLPFILGDPVGNTPAR